MGKLEYLHSHNKLSLKSTNQMSSHIWGKRNILDASLDLDCANMQAYLYKSAQ